MEFYNYLKQYSKPRHIRLSQQYVECYEFVQSLSPFKTENYLAVLDKKTRELKNLEKQIEECGGTVVAGVVSFKNKAVKKFIKRKPQ